MERVVDSFSRNSVHCNLEMGRKHTQQGNDTLACYIIDLIKLSIQIIIIQISVSGPKGRVRPN